MKKRLFAGAVIVLCLSVIAGSTLAYFTDRDTAHNVISTGTVGIEVVEQQDQDGVLVEYPQQPITGVMPGERVSKIVTVANTGSGEAWIRVAVEKTIALSEAAPEALPEGAVPDPALLELDFNTTPAEGGYWIEAGDWYYYSVPVAPGESTAVLFSSVVFSPEMPNAYQGCTANILVEAQAVQTRNNPMPPSGDLSQLPGWPADAAEITK